MNSDSGDEYGSCSTTESKARRRLEHLSLHLLPLRTSDCLLSTALLSGGIGLEDDEVAGPVMVGGMVMDIHAIPATPALPRTTTPGTVQYMRGGVGRNVAECVSKLGAKPFMISTVGQDPAGNLLLEHWTSVGLSTQGIQRRHDVGTAVICNIFDLDGELASAVASVDAIEKYLNPEWILNFKDSISSAPIVMIDANLNSSALEVSCQLAAKSGTPVWFEPVSVTKSKRIASIVKYVTIASPNEDELIAMANAVSYKDKAMFEPVKVNDETSVKSLFWTLKPAIQVLLEAGIKAVLVTVGSRGAFLCSKGWPGCLNIGPKVPKLHGFGKQLYESLLPIRPSIKFTTSREIHAASVVALHYPCLPASVVKLTGAGDCLVGGTIASLCSGLDLFQSVAVGIASAKAAVESDTNVPNDARSAVSAAKLIHPQLVP
uniref:Carbohydrate kinase PfkB domain-containing protein n=1 Tax=Kalanchoe fedtschenkoi TaxID=63787 RepID=A0A7N0T1L7_KALFE